MQWQRSKAVTEGPLVVATGIRINSWHYGLFGLRKMDGHAWLQDLPKNHQTIVRYRVYRGQRAC
jgi:hypothetical protein